MKEKKDFDVSFNTTLSDVSLPMYQLISIFLCISFHEDGSINFLGIILIILIMVSRERAADASMLCQRRSSPRHQKTMQS